jgi:predicted nucleic acid-binding Zn ribbon protein
MAEPTNPREIAEHAIRDAVEAINDADVERATSVHRRRFGLTGDQAAALRAEVDELIRWAVVTVTFPGSPGRKFTIGEPDDADVTR